MMDGPTLTLALALTLLSSPPRYRCPAPDILVRDLYNLYMLFDVEHPTKPGSRFYVSGVGAAVIPVSFAAATTIINNIVSHPSPPLHNPQD